MKKKNLDRKDRTKYRIKRNDIVVAIAGRDKGKKGKVLKVLPKTNRIIVEGVNFVKKHTRPSQDNQQGGIIQKEASLHISNVLLYCASADKPTRIGFNRLADGSKVRISRKYDVEV
ncbi:MAG: 50S ribosomal protein L24 [Chlamydiota bacterium]|nr:50S ribosomal protein L24 [Chlamydiota bacterium]